MNEVRATVQRITTDLNTLMRQLSGSEDRHARQLIDEILNGEMLSEFKSAVDAMRHLLWIYVEAVYRTQGREPATVAEAARLQRAVDMLRSLHPSATPPTLSTGQTFFDHMQTVVDEYNTMKPPLLAKSDAA
jgi:hypothetical protein